MSLRGRLSRLESRSVSRSRCENCWNWPKVRVIATDWRTNNPPVEPVMPEVCQVCGFIPASVVIEEVEDWRAERNLRPE